MRHQQTIGATLRVLLPVSRCSSHMAGATLGNWTLLSTLISDAPTPQTPCRHLKTTAVKILIVLTCKVNWKPVPRKQFTKHVEALWSFTYTKSSLIYTEKRAGHRSANTTVLLGSLMLQLQKSPWHSDLTQPKCCDRWKHKVQFSTPITCCLLYLKTVFKLNLAPREERSVPWQSIFLTLKQIKSDQIEVIKKKTKKQYLAVKDTSPINSRDLEVI